MTNWLSGQCHKPFKIQARRDGSTGCVQRQHFAAHLMWFTITLIKYSLNTISSSFKIIYLCLGGLLVWTRACGFDNIRFISFCPQSRSQPCFSWNAAHLHTKKMNSKPAACLSLPPRAPTVGRATYWFGSMTAANVCFKYWLDLFSIIYLLTKSFSSESVMRLFLSIYKNQAAQVRKCFPPWQI